MSGELVATTSRAPLKFMSTNASTLGKATADHTMWPQRSGGPTAIILCLAHLVLLSPLGLLSLLIVPDAPMQAALRCFQTGVLGAVAFTVLAVTLNPVALYMPRRISEQCFAVFLLWCAVVAIVYATAASRLAIAGVPSAWAVTWFVAGSFAVIGARVATGKRLRAVHHKGGLATRVALVGPAADLKALREFLEQPEHHKRFKVAGCFTDDVDAQAVDDLEDYRTADSLPYAIGALQVDMVIATPSWGDRAAVNRICGRLRAVPAPVHLLTEIAEAGPVLARNRQRLAGRILIELWALPLATSRAWVKRAEDLVIGGALLLALLPLMAMIAAIIRLESPGPAIFRQMRYGFANRPIRVSKFRTMRQDLGDATGAGATVRNDPRVTRFGALLRRTSLDELPQLFDVLRGDMSLVGPRAHPVEMKVGGRYYADVVRSYATRHLVKPGMSGLAQINGCRGHVDTRAKAEQRVEFDVQYIEQWSLMLDLKILWRSVFVGFVNENAY